MLQLDSGCSRSLLNTRYCPQHTVCLSKGILDITCYLPSYFLDRCRGRRRHASASTIHHINGLNSLSSIRSQERPFFLKSELRPKTQTERDCRQPRLARMRLSSNGMHFQRLPLSEPLLLLSHRVACVPRCREHQKLGWSF
jgi:hypothetical protein